MSELKLIDRQRGVVARMEALHKTILAEDRGFNTEERSEWDKLIDEQERFRKQAEIEDQLRQATDACSDEKRDQDQRLQHELGRRAAELPPTGVNNPDRPWTPAEKRAAFKGWAIGEKAGDQQRELARRAGWTKNEITIDFAREFGAPKSIAEVNAIYEQRAQTGIQSGTTAGGYTVADEMMRQIEIALLQFGSVRSVATVITTATGAPLPIPTVNDTNQVGAILNENTGAAAQDVTFGQLVLDSYKYSSKNVICSVEFMQDSTLDVGAFMGAILGERIARIQNQHYTTANGSGLPRGIVDAAATSSITTASNTAITWSEVLNLKHAVDPAYRQGAAWMCKDTVLLQLKKMLDSQLRPLYVPDLQGGGRQILDGDPVIVNQDMASGSATKELIYGLMSKYIVREVTGINLLRLDERYADQHSVAFLAFMRSDGDLLNAGVAPVKYLTAFT